MQEPDSKTLVRMYEIASQIKACDEQLRYLIQTGREFLVYYSPRGQEIIAAAIGAQLGPRDYVVTTYRGLHDQIAKGVPLRELVAEYLGRSTGTCKGKGGGMHVTHPDSGLMLTTGIVGGGIPIANGLALAAQLRGENQVTVCNFGDGASNIGAFHESMNLASLWKLPVVFCCQNNGWAEHTAFVNGTAGADIASRGAGYGMPGVAVDGNDGPAMARVAHEAIDRARSGGGPTLIEAKTDRMLGHFFGDDSSYRPAGQEKALIDTDPLPAFGAWLVAQGHLTADQRAEIDEATKTAAVQAVEAAVASSYAGPEELLVDVYAKGH